MGPVVVFLLLLNVIPLSAHTFPKLEDFRLPSIVGMSSSGTTQPKRPSREQEVLAERRKLYFGAIKQR